MEDRTLQSVVFSDTCCPEESLFLRRDGDVRIDSDSRLCLRKYALVRTDTYMNTFDWQTWRKYCGELPLYLELQLSGKCLLKIAERAAGAESVFYIRKIDCRQESRIAVPIEKPSLNGVLFFILEALEETVVTSACYTTDACSNDTETRTGLVICTYHRQEQVLGNIEKLKATDFFRAGDYLEGRLPVCVVDNGSELPPLQERYLRLVHNPNTGGSGGFTRGIHEFRKRQEELQLTHLIFMDDDVEFIPESLYRLHALLSRLKPEYADSVVAGRMFRTDTRHIQYTAAEIWNGGDLRHIGFNCDMTDPAVLNTMNDSQDAEYGGWWFCCFPMDFVMQNDPMPFFLHCDDVEYGLRHGGIPIILNGVQVWHETYEYRQSPVITYYDTRNSLIVNTLYGSLQSQEKYFERWSSTVIAFHQGGEFIKEYMSIKGMIDFLSGTIIYDYEDGVVTNHKLSQLANISEKKNERLFRQAKRQYKKKYQTAVMKYQQMHASRKTGGTEVPKLTVIIPVYNEEKYLKACIDSVLNQTFRDIEVICVDDGSTDSSAQMMDDYMLIDSRVRVIHKANSGYGNSMNRGLAAAKGEYIGIVESDDSIIPQMYEILYAMTENGTADVVKGNFWDCYDEKDGSVTRVVNQERVNMPDVKDSFTINEYPQLLWGHPSIWTGIYRRRFLKDNHIVFKEEKGGGWVDNPFFFDTLFKAEKIRWTKQPLYQYRKTNAASSSVGYNLRIPFDRMMDNLAVAEKDGFTDEETRKFMYARALMYLVGATNEKHYPYNEDEVRPLMREMLLKMDSDIITDDFNLSDQKHFWKYRSPLPLLLKKTKKVLIYNWIPFDNPAGVGGGVTIYCRNLVAALLRYRPDVQVYFLSSGWAYDVTKSECYFRKTENIYGDRCRSFEIVNSPVPAPQDMLFYNPSFAFENRELRNVFLDFVEKNGPFNSIHFNNIEGLSLDVLSLKLEFPETQFVYSMHNYVPICMTGFYYRRDLHCNCKPGHTADDCDNCINRQDGRRLRREMINRAIVNVPNTADYDEDRWALKFGFEKLEMLQDKSYMHEYTQRATEAINTYCDVVLAVSEKVHEIAKENGIVPELIKTNYIGTKVANFQIRRSNVKPDKPFKLVFLGSNVGYEEKGYPFLLESLQQLDKKHAAKVDLVLTTTSKDQDTRIRLMTKKFRSVRIIHGYSHQDLHNILNGCHLGVIPVLWEDNLPQIAIEMVAHGVPVLSSDAGGASELCASELFRFRAGDTDDFLQKLTAIIDEPQKINEFWKNHYGLKDMKHHLEEIEEVLALGKMNDERISITVQEYADLIEENAFLYKHLSDGSGISGLTRTELNRKDAIIHELQERVIEPGVSPERHMEELQQVIDQRDYLQYVIDETRKSKTYKIGRAITALPRAIREKQQNNQ